MYSFATDTDVRLDFIFILIEKCCVITAALRFSIMLIILRYAKCTSEPLIRDWSYKELFTINLRYTHFKYSDFDGFINLNNLSGCLNLRKKIFIGSAPGYQNKLISARRATSLNIFLKVCFLR